MDLLVMLMLTFVKTKLDAVSISVEHHRYFPTTLTHFLNFSLDNDLDVSLMDSEGGMKL